MARAGSTSTYFFRHGVMLEDLPQADPRARARPRGHHALGTGVDAGPQHHAGQRAARRVSGSPDEFGEWPYFVSIFGYPGAGEPWGWQLDGHHLNVNCAVLDDQIVLTPTFMGSEPCRFVDGPAGRDRRCSRRRSGAGST